MKIGIIGAGNIGGTLTRLLTARGHEVAVANSRGPETLAGLAAETGAHAVPVSEVARGAEVVVVAIPEHRVPDLPAGVLDGAAPEAVVIDTGNYYPRRDGRIEPIEAGTTESRWVADELGRPVVKVFNTIYSRVLSEGGSPRARRAGSPCRSRATTRRRRPSCRGWSTSSASIRSTPAASTIPGASSRGRRSTAPTSTRRAPAAHSPRRFPRGTRTGAADPPAACCRMQRRTWHPLDEAEASSGSAGPLRPGATRGVRGR